MKTRLFCILMGVVWILSIFADFTSRIFAVITDGALVALMVAFVVHIIRQQKK